MAVFLALPTTVGTGGWGAVRWILLPVRPVGAARFSPWQSGPSLGAHQQLRLRCTSLRSSRRRRKRRRRPLCPALPPRPLPAAAKSCPGPVSQKPITQEVFLQTPPNPAQPNPAPPMGQSDSTPCLPSPPFSTQKGLFGKGGVSTKAQPGQSSPSLPVPRATHGVKQTPI